MCAVTALPGLDRGLVLEPKGEHPCGLSIPPTKHVCLRDTSECVRTKGPWVHGLGSAWAGLQVGGSALERQVNPGEHRVTEQPKYTQSPGSGAPCGRSAPTPSQVSSEGGGEGLPNSPNTVALALVTTPQPAARSCVRWGGGQRALPPSTLNMGPHWADGPQGLCTTL